jgi:hypothetical protein
VGINNQADTAAELLGQPAEKVRAQAGSVGFRLSKQSFLEGLSVFRAASANYPIWEIG